MSHALRSGPVPAERKCCDPGQVGDSGFVKNFTAAIASPSSPGPVVKPISWRMVGTSRSRPLGSAGGSRDHVLGAQASHHQNAAVARPSSKTGRRRPTKCFRVASFVDCDPQSRLRVKPMAPQAPAAFSSLRPCGRGRIHQHNRGASGMPSGGASQRRLLCFPSQDVAVGAPFLVVHCCRISRRVLSIPNPPEKPPGAISVRPAVQKRVLSHLQPIAAIRARDRAGSRTSKFAAVESRDLDFSAGARFRPAGTPTPVYFMEKAGIAVNWITSPGATGQSDPARARLLLKPPGSRAPVKGRHRPDGSGNAPIPATLREPSCPDLCPSARHAWRNPRRSASETAPGLRLRSSHQSFQEAQSWLVGVKA